MNSLKNVLAQNAGILNDRKELKKALHNEYPDERTANILLILSDCSFIYQIANMESVSEKDIERLAIQFEYEFGISPEYSRNCIMIWADALGTKCCFDSQNTGTGEIVTDAMNDFVCYDEYETVDIGNNCLAIKKYLGFDNEVIVPSRIKGKRVTTIGDFAFSNCRELKCVVVSEGIVKICTGAFFHCDSLEHVKLPSTLKELGTGRLRSKTNDSYTNSGGFDFGDIFCESLLGYNINKTGEGAFEGCAIEEIILPSNVDKVGKEAFSNCKRLTKIILPKGLSVVPERCFSGCDNLQYIGLPKSLKTIGEYAFAYTNIDEIVIPSTVVEIGDYAFSCCYGLERIVLHEGLESIGSAAFRNCKNLSSILIPRSVKSIADNAFTYRSDVFYGESKLDITIICYISSYALEYARERGFTVKNALS